MSITTVEPPKMKENPRIAKARASLPKMDIKTVEQPTETVEGPVEGSVSTETETEIRPGTKKYNATVKEMRNMCILNALRSAVEPLNQTEIASRVGVANSVVSVGIRELMNMGAAKMEYVVTDNGRRAQKYSFVSIPEGWTPEMLNNAQPIARVNSSHQTVPKIKVNTPKKAKRKAWDNPLSDMLSQEPIVLPEAIRSYEQFIKDTTRHYGCEELDKLVDCLHTICKQRIMNASEKCPKCGNPMHREGTAIMCRECHINIDCGDSYMSLMMVRQFKTLRNEVDQ